MTVDQSHCLGGHVKYVSFTLTNTADLMKTWLSGATDLNTGTTVAFSLDNLVGVLFTGYTGTIKYGGSNSQPISAPANSDWTIPCIAAHNDTYIVTSAATFTVYAILAFG